MGNDYTKEDLLNCRQKIASLIHNTAILTSKSLDQLTGAQLFFKCENFQRSGSFKIRGATYAIACLSEQDRAKGVVAHSSGNFAQAISLAANSVGTRACVAMPSSAPAIKVAATAAYGGEIVTTAPTAEDRERIAAELVEQRGATFIHPSNDVNVMLGQGTAAMELLESVPDLQTVLVPVGGGGLIGGTSLAVHFFGDRCTTIGAEPFAVDDAYRSLASGKIEFNQTTDTIADGLRTFLGNHNFPVIQRHVERIIRVTEEEIVAAMKLIWQRLKIVIEPSCAVPFAAVCREKDAFSGKKVGIILTGGNIDLENLPF